MKTTANQAGRKGGKSTLKKYGKKHYQRLAKKRWSVTKKGN